MTGKILILTATSVAASMSACSARADRPSPANVSVQLLARDPAGARFRICNNGFQPIRRVEFTVGGQSFSADTVLDQAHCAEVTRSESPALTDSTAVVTRVVAK